MSDLAEKQQRIASLQGELSETQAQLAQANELVRSLRGREATLQGTISTLQFEVVQGAVHLHCAANLTHLVTCRSPRSSRARRRPA